MSERVYLSFDRYSDSEALRDALRGGRYHSFITEFDQSIFRRIIKYGDFSQLDFLSKDQMNDDDLALITATIEKLREIYWSMYQEATEEE